MFGSKQCYLTEELEGKEEDYVLVASESESDGACGEGVGEGEGLGDEAVEELPAGGSSAAPNEPSPQGSF